MKNKTLNRMKTMVSPYKKQIIFLTILSIIINIIVLIKPYIIKIVIDNFLETKQECIGNISITIISYIYLALVIVENVLEYINRVKTNIIGESVVFDLRNKLFYYMEYMNIKFHDKFQSGKWFVRIVSDTEDIFMLFSDVITTVLKDVFCIIGLFAIMVYINYKLALASCIVIPLMIISSIVITKLLNKTYSAVKIVRTKLNTFFSESIYGIKLIKIFNRQQEKQEECEEITEEFKQTIKPNGYLQGLMHSVMFVIENLGISILIGFIINQYLGIELNIGVIYMFITYFKNIFEPINRLLENIEVVEEAVTSIEKVYEILDRTDCLEDFESGKKIDKINGKIEFKNVWFAYEKENWVLKDVSFTINPGESVALVGKTGSGKTTITNLINKFYTIQKGEILIDGININDINIIDLRRKIGTILQDPFIYAKSIKDNVKLFNNIPDEKINEGIKLASASQFINSLECGVDTIARERGASFSAGEKQLIAFARIFALNPSIFILDEATANIDTITEQLVQKSVDILSQDKTSIFIAHRLSTIVNVDKILVLNNGSIIEQGNHNELVENGGYYSELYSAYYSSLI